VATVKEIQKKKFKLNDSLEDVLGRRLVPFDKRDITIDMLLRHRSGLAPIFKLSGQQKNADKLIKHLLSAKLRANPNEKFIYSDTGFALLAQIVAKNNNRSFNEYLKRVIIPELGMKNTYLYAPPSGVTPRTVKAHNEDNYVVHDPRAKKMPNGAGHAGVFTTAKELSKLVLHLLEAKTGPLYGSYARLMTKKGSAGIRGLGLDVNSRYNKPLKGSCFSSGSFGHTGYTGTSFIADPATGDYLIILTNRTLSPLEFGKSVSGLNQFRTQMADMVCRY
jgi:CubicO group peptidase (beta-lactamase class C family)